MLIQGNYRNRVEQQRSESLETAELLKEREAFLKANPDLRATQDEIDALLSGTLDPSTRLEIVFMLLTEKLLDLQKACSDLMQTAQQAIGK